MPCDIARHPCTLAGLHLSSYLLVEVHSGSFLAVGAKGTNIDLSTKIHFSINKGSGVCENQSLELIIYHK